VAALALARHVSADGTLDSLRASYQIEQRLTGTLALYLPRLEPRAIKDLKKRLDSLPPSGSVAAATLRMQEAMLSWIVGEVKEAKDRESLLAFLSQLGREKRRAEGQALLDACGGTAEGVLKFAEEMRRGSALLAKTLDLPLDQIAKAFAREEKKLAGNPVFKIFAPVLLHAGARRAQAEVRRALLSAALAVQLDGWDALQHHPDPMLGGPFDHATFAGGFELRSRLKPDDALLSGFKPDTPEPLVLTVGRRK
jgi:hypothetical protein